MLLCMTVWFDMKCLNVTSDEFVDIGTTLNNIGVCLFQMDRFQESYLYMQSAEEIMTQRLELVLSYYTLPYLNISAWLICWLDMR
jgi:hypothetical protein